MVRLTREREEGGGEGGGEGGDEGLDFGRKRIELRERPRLPSTYPKRGERRRER